MYGTGVRREVVEAHRVKKFQITFSTIKGKVVSKISIELDDGSKYTRKYNTGEIKEMAYFLAGEWVRVKKGPVGNIIWVNPY